MKYLIIILLILASCGTLQKPKEVITIKQDTIDIVIKPNVIYGTDTITTRNFYAYYDTIIKNQVVEYKEGKPIIKYKYDTLHIDYKFPENLFWLNYRPSADTSKIITEIKEKRVFEKWDYVFISLLFIIVLIIAKFFKGL